LIFQEYAPATLDLLGEERVTWLRQLPAQQRVEDLVLVHAAPGDLWRAPVPDAEDDELAAVYGSLDAATTVYGHIHRPFTRTMTQLTVANSGSVGMPWDGDPRACYLVIEDGRPHSVRVEYDIEREAALLLGSGYPDASRLVEMRRRGLFLRPGVASAM
jgi:diadenosine tetraphosphatase ApaH/serine/threonine PP2A family protein phosphatase